MANRPPKILATIPDKYSPDFAERLDKRTSIAKAICGRIETIESDMGGAESLSHARRSLIRRTVWLEAIIEHSEQRLAAGEGIDLGGHTQAINTLIGLCRLIGLERRAKPVERLSDLMYRDDEPEPPTKPDPGDASEATADDRSAADATDATEEIAAGAPPEAAP